MIPSTLQSETAAKRVIRNFQTQESKIRDLYTVMVVGLGFLLMRMECARFFFGGWGKIGRGGEGEVVVVADG